MVFDWHLPITKRATVNSVAENVFEQKWSLILRTDLVGSLECLFTNWRGGLAWPAYIVGRPAGCQFSKQCSKRVALFWKFPARKWSSSPSNENIHTCRQIVEHFLQFLFKTGSRYTIECELCGVAEESPKFARLVRLRKGQVRTRPNTNALKVIATFLHRALVFIATHRSWAEFPRSERLL